LQYGTFQFLIKGYHHRRVENGEDEAFNSSLKDTRIALENRLRAIKHFQFLIKGYA